MASRWNSGRLVTSHTTSLEWVVLGKMADSGRCEWSISPIITLLFTVLYASKMGEYRCLCYKWPPLCIRSL